MVNKDHFYVKWSVENSAFSFSLLPCEKCGRQGLEIDRNTIEPEYRHEWNGYQCIMLLIANARCPHCNHSGKVFNPIAVTHELVESGLLVSHLPIESCT